MNIALLQPKLMILSTRVAKRTQNAHLSVSFGGFYASLAAKTIQGLSRSMFVKSPETQPWKLETDLVLDAAAAGQFVAVADGNYDGRLEEKRISSLQNKTGVK